MLQSPPSRHCTDPNEPPVPIPPHRQVAVNAHNSSVINAVSLARALLDRAESYPADSLLTEWARRVLSTYATHVA